MEWLLPIFGAFAGVLTTLTGQGGGVVLLLACAAVTNLPTALAVTTPALLMGNLHRTWLYRAHVDRVVAIRVIAGAVPGAILGGVAVGALPAWSQPLVLLALTGLAIAKALGLVRLELPQSALTPVAFGIGIFTGATGGAGVLFASVLLGYGLSGPVFIGTMSLVAASVHVGRVLAYASIGLFDRDTLGLAAIVSLAIFAGNAVGERARTRVSATTGRRLEYGTLVVCTILSLVALRP